MLKATSDRKEAAIERLLDHVSGQCACLGPSDICSGCQAILEYHAAAEEVERNEKAGLGDPVKC